MLVPGLLVLMTLATVAAYAMSRPRPARATEHDPAQHAGHDMSEAAMQAMVDEFYESHPRVPAQPASVLGAFSVEYLAVGTTFSADGDFVGTLVDTVVIGVGETVQWRRLIGVHTVTSGINAADPQAGLLFDVPLDAATPIFQYTYNLEGTYPFFCRPHEDFDMRGVVIVVGPTPNHSTTWGELKARSRERTPSK
jgi:plastocyanin